MSSQQADGARYREARAGAIIVRSMALKARYREPYNARHSFVSWNFMA